MDECEIAAKKWILRSYNEEIEMGEIIPIVAGEDIISYCVTFVEKTEPNGYIIIDANRNATNYLLEFSLSGNSIYDTLAENSGVGKISKSNEKVIYSVGAFDYAIQTGVNSFYTNTDEIIFNSEINECGKEIKKHKAKTRSIRSTEEKKEIFDGFFTDSTIPSTGFSLESTISGADSFIPSIMSELRAENGHSGNCTPTAAANLLSFYKEQRGFSRLPETRQLTYNRIVLFSGWDQFGDSGMALSVARLGMMNVALLSGYNYSSDTYSSNLMSDWTRDLQDDYPVLTAVWGYMQSDDGWIEVGHSVVAVGFKAYAMSGTLYLRVYDGWNRTNDRYICFSSEYFTSIKGICVKVS